jgi:Protein of unknown function (DUF2892)
MATLARSRERSERKTPAAINDRIRRETEASIARTLAVGRPAIDARLRELDQEWDTERTLQTLAASFSLAGLVLGTGVNRKWLILNGAVAAFLLQHGLQGWCPPLPVIRALGVRTPAEIDRERYALKVARGDFAGQHAPSGALSPAELLAAVNR